jgi:Prephenate dehydratase
LGLHTALGPFLRPSKFFADRQINLTKIESRTNKKQNLGNIIFLWILLGNINDQKVKEAIEDLKKSYNFLLRVLGSYPAELI